MITFRKGNLKLALQSLRTNKARSFLTMLGIIIGVMAVILVVSISEGVKKQISGQHARYGADMVVIRPDSAKRSIFTGDGLPSGVGTMLTPADVGVVRDTPGVAHAVPLSAVSGSVKADKEINNPLVVATTVDLPIVLKQKVEYGSFFEYESATPTAVLGQNVARQLFTDSIPLGQTFTYRGQQFMVAGLFEKFTAPPFSLESNFNDAIFVPYRTIQTMLNSTPGIYEILTQTKPDTDHKALVATLDTKLRTAHGGAKDFAIGGEGADNGSSDQTLNLLTMMTIGMAFVAFIVGGVGIMNVMLVSVTERIHEIGLRKAIGATNRQILNQFIAEAFVLSLFGAVAGVVGSVFTIYLLRFFTNLQPVFVWQVMVSVPLVAIATGVLFGSFPAFKAAQKDPIEALRHE